MSIGGRCATCRWWTTKDEQWILSDGEGACLLLSTNEGDDQKSPMAAAVGHWGDGVLFTGAEFGCVLWEERQ